MTVIQLGDRVRTEGDAYKFMEELRWGDHGPACPHCDSRAATYIRPMNGESRKTRTGAMSERRVWRCDSCRKQFSVITGTVFHGTKVSLRKWVLVIFEMCASKNGVSAREVERKYGVCGRTAWFMMHRIREAMKTDALVQTMRGVVVADETFIGGKGKNRKHGQRFHPPTTDGHIPIVPGKRRMNDHLANKTAVLSLVDSTGQVRSRVVPDVTGATLRKAIAEQVDMANTILHTDEAKSYKTFAHELLAHETVNHSEDEYVRYENGKVITSNQAENYFSQLKRSLDGTHHHVSRTHLPRYLAEFDYRHSTRSMSDTERMAQLMGKVDGKRLTYKRVSS